MPTSDLLRRSASSLVLAMQSGELSPVEVVSSHIDRINAVNPRLNALVTPHLDEALQTARRLEALSQERRRGLRLFGLPVTVKDALAVRGMRFTAGLKSRAEVVADVDADVVQRLRDAGAVLLGKSNCPEMSVAPHTDNLLFGPTRNPWDLTRSPGGSSGGEGALVGCGGSPLGLGSDIAGSVRVPAAFCGAVGLKPTPGRISTLGHMPQAPVALEHWNTVGPIGRTVADIHLALTVLSVGPVTPLAELSLEGARLVTPPPLRVLPLDREVKAGLRQAAAVLERAGMRRVDGSRLPLHQLAAETAGRLHDHWLPAAAHDLGDGKRLRLFAETQAALRGEASVSTTALSGLLALRLSRPLLCLLRRPRRGELARLRRRLLEELRGDGLILWPVFPSTAPRPDFVFGPRVAPGYTGMFNALGLPAVAVPIGRDSRGLPRSVQLVAPPGGDELALRAAVELESALGGFEPAPLAC